MNDLSTTTDSARSPADAPGALVPVEWDYEASWGIDAAGLAHSREATIWTVDGALAGVPAALDRGCHTAALCYPERVAAAFPGLLFAAADDQGRPAIYLRPLRRPLLQFGPLSRQGAGHFVYPIEDGWLVARNPGETTEAIFTFRWWREAGRETFETRFDGFRPAIRGVATRAPFRALVYRFSQTLVHVFVMRLFHRWVRHQRARLMAAPPQILPDHR